MAEISHLSQNDGDYDPCFIFDSYQKGVCANFAAAHYGIAKCYVQATGTDAETDSKLALHHAQKSADLGHAQGIRYLGNCYIYGRGMGEPDVKKGITLLKKSIARGNVMAEYTIHSNKGFPKPRNIILE
ncbi:MAG: TPR repeat protein [Paracoccaceae bacterium]